MRERAGIVIGALAALVLLLVTAPVASAVSTRTTSATTARSSAGLGTAVTGTGAVGGRVVLIGVAGLRWNAITRTGTPNLWELARRGGMGLLSVRTVGSSTCPADGWATISAGTRSAAGRFCHQPVRPAAAGQGAIVTDYPDIRRFNADRGYSTTVGSLGEAIHRGGGCTTAVGPGAALAAADTTGRVDLYAPVPDALPPAGWTRCPVTVVDTGALARTPAQTRDADATIGKVLAALPEGTTVLVAGISDHDATPHLRVALSGGASATGHYLGSDSTRRSDMVILPDLTATMLEVAGVRPPAAMIGTPWRPTAEYPGVAAAVTHLARADVAAQTTRWLLPRFFIGFVVGQLLLYGGAALALRFVRGENRPRMLVFTRIVALAAAAVPLSAYLVNLVPWWRSTHPASAILAGMAVADAMVVAVALRGPWRRSLLGPGTLIAVVTAVVLALDLLTGAGLQLNSLMGYSPLVGGRYYGIGNIAFAVLATCTLLAAAGVAQTLEDRRVNRTVRVAAVLAMTLTAAVLDSWTAWGSDFGGLIAFVPGLATTALMVAGRRMSLLGVSALRAAGLLLVLGVAFIDYLRPPGQRTHLGRFFDQLIHGDATPMLTRKLTAMLHTYGNLTLTPVVIAAAMFLLLVLRRPGRARVGALELAYERAPLLRAGLTGTFITAVVGGAVNDSGIAIPAIALAIAVPLALAASMRTLEMGERRHPATPPRRSTATPERAGLPDAQPGLELRT